MEGVIKTGWILLLLVACEKHVCVESEYVNCKVNKGNFEKIVAGQRPDELYQILGNKNALKSPVLGQASALKEWDYNILWVQCSMVCGNGNKKEAISVKIKNGKVLRASYSDE